MKVLIDFSTFTDEQLNERIILARKGELLVDEIENYTGQDADALDLLDDLTRRKGVKMIYLWWVGQAWVMIIQTDKLGMIRGDGPTRARAISEAWMIFQALTGK